MVRAIDRVWRSASARCCKGRRARCCFSETFGAGVSGKLTRGDSTADRLVDLRGVERAMLDQCGSQRIDDICMPTQDRTCFRRASRNENVLRLRRRIDQPGEQPLLLPIIGCRPDVAGLQLLGPDPAVSFTTRANTCAWTSAVSSRVSRSGGIRSVICSITVLLLASPQSET
jgi:hypothetical protein